MGSSLLQPQARILNISEPPIFVRDGVQIRRPQRYSFNIVYH